jgi:hypothetical protein
MVPSKRGGCFAHWRAAKALRAMPRGCEWRESKNGRGWKYMPRSVNSSGRAVNPK